MSQSDWIQVCGEAAPELSAQLSASVAQRVQRGDYPATHPAYVQKVTLALAQNGLAISKERLEKLQRMCQLWDVDIKVTKISSHRKVIGPVIVAVKKLFFPFIRFVLKDFIEQQREFNATSIALLADLSNDLSSTKK